MVRIGRSVMNLSSDRAAINRRHALQIIEDRLGFIAEFGAAARFHPMRARVLHGEEAATGADAPNAICARMKTKHVAIGAADVADARPRADNRCGVNSHESLP